MLIVGLTGSIGMGKTTTAEMFRRAGVPVHDSDAAVHELYASAAVAPISQAFPGVVREGVVDRRALSEKVLGDAGALKALEEIVHPLVMQHRNMFVAQAREQGYPCCVVDIPLLFETNADRLVNSALVVTASSVVQKQRVLSRPGMTEAKFNAILSRQMPDPEKRRRAHFLIDTSRGLDSANRQVDGYLRALSR